MHIKYVFIIGTGRCGTEWLGRWLGQFPKCSYCGETYFFCHANKIYQKNNKTLSTIRRLIVDYYSKWENKKNIIIDTTHTHFQVKDFIKKCLPKSSRFIHVYRDGKNVVYSLRNVPWRKNKTKQIEDDINLWIQYMKSVFLNNDKSILHIKYEDLVDEPNESKVISEFLGINHYFDIEPWKHPVNTQHSYHNMDWWKNLSQEDLSKMTIMNETLVKLGYFPV